MNNFQLIKWSVRVEMYKQKFERQAALHEIIQTNLLPLWGQRSPKEN